MSAQDEGAGATRAEPERPKHTPGPWSAATQAGLPVVITRDGTKVADPMFSRGLKALADDGQYRHEIAANTHLIATAPELYLELETTISTLEILFPRDTNGPIRDAIARGKAILAKARGESNE